MKPMTYRTYQHGCSPKPTKPEFDGSGYSLHEQQPGRFGPQAEGVRGAWLQGPQRLSGALFALLTAFEVVEGRYAGSEQLQEAKRRSDMSGWRGRSGRPTLSWLTRAWREGGLIVSRAILPRSNRPERHASFMIHCLGRSGKASRRPSRL